MKIIDLIRVGNIVLYKGKKYVVIKAINDGKDTIVEMVHYRNSGSYMSHRISYTMVNEEIELLDIIG